MPQWSPVNVTGNTPTGTHIRGDVNAAPQWSPVNVTGNTWGPNVRNVVEYWSPQWSPVNVTGNTRGSVGLVAAERGSRNGAR